MEIKGGYVPPAKEVSELVKAITNLTDTMICIEKNAEIINKQIDFDEKRSMLHSNSMVIIIISLKMMTKWAYANNSERNKLKKSFNKVTEDLQSWKRFTINTFPSTSDNNSK